MLKSGGNVHIYIYIYIFFYVCYFFSIKRNLNEKSLLKTKMKYNILKKKDKGRIVLLVILIGFREWKIITIITIATTKNLCLICNGKEIKVIRNL